MYMKKYRIIAILFFIVCIAVIIIGAVLHKGWLSLAGIITLFGVSFSTAVIASIVVVVKAVKGVKAEDNEAISDDALSDENDGDDDNEEFVFDEQSEKNVITERDLEQARIERINSTAHTENRIARAEYMMSHTGKTAKSSTKKEKTLGTVFLIVLLALMFGGIVLIAVGWQIAGLICVGGFAAVIIIAIIITVIKQKLAMSIKRFDESNPQKGMVISCTVSSQTTNGSKYYERVISTTYKLKIDVNGTVCSSYCKTFYSAGDIITVLPSKKGNDSVYVVEELSEQSEYDETDMLDEIPDNVSDNVSEEEISDKSEATEAAVTADEVSFDSGESAVSNRDSAQKPSVRKPRKLG